MTTLTRNIAHFSNFLAVKYLICLWNHYFWIFLTINIHCVKGVSIRSYSGPHFPAFILNTEKYGVSLRIHSKYVKIRTRTTPNMDTFHAWISPDLYFSTESLITYFLVTYSLHFCHFWIFSYKHFQDLKLRKLSEISNFLILV